MSPEIYMQLLAKVAGDDLEQYPGGEEHLGPRRDHALAALRGHVAWTNDDRTWLLTYAGPMAREEQERGERGPWTEAQLELVRGTAC